jgi:hypothetical protein
VTKVFVDGVEINALRVEIVTGTGTPPPDPIPKPTPAPTDCGRVPPEVRLMGDLDLRNSGGVVKVSMGNGTRSACWRFRTGSDPAFYAAIEFASTTGTSGVRRIAWIGQCAGTPYPGLGVRCAADGGENTSLRISEGPRRGYCELEPHTTYYVHVRNATPNDPTGTTGPGDVYRTVYPSS